MRTGHLGKRDSSNYVPMENKYRKTEFIICQDDLINLNTVLWRALWSLVTDIKMRLTYFIHTLKTYLNMVKRQRSNS